MEIPEREQLVSTRGTRDLWIDDPLPTTPFEVVDEGGLLRLRHYRCEGGPVKQPPVLLVYSLVKRPYILDLLPDRSVVRSFLQQGFSVYLTDWLPPNPEDARRGLDAYVAGDLTRAVECVQHREGVERVSLVGCCFGGLLAIAYAALRPETVQRLVPFALPFEMSTPLFSSAIEFAARMYGNVPAWMIRAALNARVANRLSLAALLAQDLREPELPQSTLECALQTWVDSDVPLSGRIACEIMRDALRDAQFAESRLHVGDRRVALDAIRCPVLNIIAEYDRLVPPASSSSLIDRVGSRIASNLIFPTGHLGLMISLAAQQRLWPRVGAWLRTPVRRRAAVA